MKTPSSRWHRKWLVCCGIFALFVFVALRLTTASPPYLTERGSEEAAASAASDILAIEVPGRTQCILSRKCTIAPVPLHPVVEVLVEPGSRVKKGQVLVKLDDDEAQADVRNKQALLENAKLTLQEARRHLKAVEPTFQQGALPEHRYYEIRVAALKAEKDEQAAQAALDAAKAELEHFEVTAQIEGVVSWLEVHLGMVSRPGTTTWGEILDLREIDVGCELTLDQVDQVAVGQAVEVRKNGKKGVFGIGHVVFVGIKVDKAGLVTVCVRLPNPGASLRCGEPVQVRFTSGAGERRP